MIVRTARRNRYTVVCNNLIEDPDLDWKDLGLLVYLLSKPDDWQISVEHLKKQKKMGRDGIYKCLDAIINAGYARREKHSDGSVYWYIFEEKQTEEKPNPEKPEKATEHQIRKSRNTENPNPENPTLINTEYKQILNKEITNTEVNTPQKKKSDSATKKIKKQITQDWQPSERCFELIQQAGISLNYAESLINGFIFYWQETGEKRPGWDATFLNHVKFMAQKSQRDLTSTNAGSFNNGNNYDTKRTKNAIDWDCDF